MSTALRGILIRCPLSHVEFMASGDDAGLTRLPPAEIPTVKARVLGNHRMVCGGIFTGGDVFDAPHNDETRLWLKQGYIELVPAKLIQEGEDRKCPIKTGSISVGTTATLIATPSSAPENDRVCSIQNLAQ